MQGPNRMVGGQSGFAAAAMGPAFSGENGTLRGNLLTSHSLGAPNTQVSITPTVAKLRCANFCTMPNSSHVLSSHMLAGENIMSS